MKRFMIKMADGQKMRRKSEVTLQKVSKFLFRVMEGIVAFLEGSFQRHKYVRIGSFFTPRSVSACKI